jgi:predicted DNA-binding protein (UPF0251 family)
LTDIEEMEQEEGSQLIGIFRRTFWKNLQRARRKIAEAVVEVKAIRIGGGSYWVVVFSGLIGSFNQLGI